ncbi:MAG: BadF/BadG/BcrA/BcrD ATPase family protein [Gemmatimonadales bacterium]|nr:BadF/BadG/BcrA/BcrD ATPase family protein [Gemmatimonadales bacterium]
MRILLGVDAGGSHTTAAVADGAGAIFVRADGGPGAMRRGGAAAAASAILQTCRDALEKAERQVKGDILVVGAAGVGREEERLALQAALEESGLAPRVVVLTDAAIALEAAFSDGPGVVLIAGTGSIAWACHPDGAHSRVGGLGPALGDQGSGYDLGRRGLRAVGLAIEGRGRRTQLTDLIMQRAHAPTLAELVAWASAAGVPAIAALAPAVLDAARDGDAVASALVDAAADDLARHVKALADRFPRGRDIRVALGGSLLVRSDDYRKRVVARIVAEVMDADILADPVDPVLGAVQLARAL